MQHLKTIAACAVTALAVGGATAEAGHLIRNHDIAKNTISLNRLTPGVQKLIRQNSTPVAAVNTPGPKGEKGDSGSAGSTGAAGAAGVQGASGAKGSDGKDGKDSVTQVTDFNGPFLSRTSNACGAAGDPKGTVALGDHAVFGEFPDGNASASIYTHAFDGKTLSDVSFAAYDAQYTQSSDAHGGTPYFRFFLNGDSTDVVYSPNTQGRTVNSGDWHREVVTSGTVRYNDDDGDGNDDTTGDPTGYGINGADWDKVKADHGSDVISQVVISMGCAGSYSDKATGQIDNLALTVGGKSNRYDFEKK